MNKSQVIDEFWKSRASMENPRLATQFRIDNSLYYDLELVKAYLPKGGKVLDLGCGTCTLTNELVPYASMIRGVDKHEGLLRFCKVGEQFETHVCDVLNYVDEVQYDLILLIGVLNYFFDDCDVEKTYRNCFRMLKPGGHLIVKQQSGVEEDIHVNNYSEELKTNYTAIYRERRKEESLLQKEGFQVKTYDIYPPEMNPWSNTHHYAYVAQKK